MKVLHISQYISIAKDKKFSRNISGYGYMVLDIAKSESEYDFSSQIDLITHNCITIGKKMGNLALLPRTWLDIIRNMRLKYIIQSLKIILHTHYSLFWILRIIFYYLGIGHILSTIKNNAYDIVHLHGICYSMVPVIQYCQKNKVKFTVTLHGLTSFDESINITKQEKILERNFLQLVKKDNLNITVVSSGVKKQILAYLSLEEADNITVILNGIYLTQYENKINVRNMYQIKLSEKIILCVGNINTRKNQMSLLYALQYISVSIKKDFKILFLGDDNTGNFRKNIYDLDIRDNIVFCGNIPRDIIYEYYSQADYTILVSKDEGFGLSIIEGFLYGLPCITFADLEAIKNLYNPKVMHLIHERTDKALADGIVQAVSKEWDKEFIKKYACQFSIETMAREYILHYKRIIHEEI